MDRMTTTQFDFPTEFATSLWQAYTGHIGAMITEAASTFDQFITNPAAHSNTHGHKYTDQDMQDLWRMIERQKARTQALWMVETGQAVAMNAALRQLGYNVPL